MKETEKVPFDSMPPLIRGSFLTKEQVEKLKEPFKDVVSVVRCKDCKNRNDSLRCPMELLKKQLEYTKVFTYGVPDDWYCADGERRKE